MKLTSSEDASALMTRGEYANNPKKHLFESYDTQKADWGSTQREDWKAVAERPFIAGCFIWTGFDYRGEPQPFSCLPQVQALALWIFAVFRRQHSTFTRHNGLMIALYYN